MINSTSIDGGDAIPSKPKDGGPAFPLQYACGRNESGISMRDYFAAAALTGLTVNQQNWDIGDFDMAKFSYDLADAMLAVREESK